MTRQILKSILVGILAGVALFMAPFFLIKLFLFFLIIGAICRLWWGGRWKRHHWKHSYQWINPDVIRNMSDEEYKTYKDKMNNRGTNHYYGCGNYYHYDCNDWQKSKPGNKNESSTDKNE